MDMGECRQLFSICYFHCLPLSQQFLTTEETEMKAKKKTLNSAALIEEGEKRINNSKINKNL